MRGIETKTRCNEPDCYACRYDDKTEHAGTELQQLISCDYIQYGDYDNSRAVERANVRYLQERDLVAYDDINYCPDCKAWVLDTPENRELLESLESYPCFDDELVSQVEDEIEQEYIKDNDDIWRETPEPLRSILDDADLRCIIPEIYYQVKESLNMQFIVESGGNSYIDLDKMVTAYNAALLEKYPALQRISALQERLTSVQWPLTFWENAEDMQEHRRATGTPYTQEEIQDVMQYCVELERAVQND